MSGDTFSAPRPSSTERKRAAILEAATAIFLGGGYLGTNMDEIATRSGVSKQTVYKHFSSKEALFTAVVSSMTDVTGDIVHEEVPALRPGDDVTAYLVEYAHRQLATVLTPSVMQLRRLVIGEVGRFPELARVLFERGPQRAIGMFTAMIDSLVAQGAIVVDDPTEAATQLNWMIMAEPLNRAMLLGDAAIPSSAELREHAKKGVRLFLAAYAGTSGPRASPSRKKSSRR